MRRLICTFVVRIWHMTRFRMAYYLKYETLFIKFLLGASCNKSLVASCNFLVPHITQLKIIRIWVKVLQLAPLSPTIRVSMDVECKIRFLENAWCHHLETHTRPTIDVKCCVLILYDGDSTIHYYIYMYDQFFVVYFLFSSDMSLNCYKLVCQSGTYCFVSSVKRAILF